MNRYIFLEKLKKIEENQDYIKEQLESINRRTSNIKIELEKTIKVIETLGNKESPEINELIEKFKRIKVDTKIIKNKLNLF